jgi:hypothetical protein
VQSDLIIDLMLEAVSPITHMSGTEGNEAVLMREPVLSEGAMCSVPVLTGNAIRHRALRSSGYLWLIARLGLDGNLTAAQANFLVNGGAVSESTRDADLRLADGGATLIPLLRVLGGCLPGQILPGRAAVGRGVMACRENEPRLRGLFGDWMDGVGRLRASGEFVAPYQYTRGDAGRYVRTDAMPTDASNLMIFSGESVVAGAVFFSRIRLRQPNDLQVGAALHALGQWDGVIGGQSARGHGRLDVSLRVVPSVDAEALIAQYVEHVDAHRDEITTWLAEAFK